MPNRGTYFYNFMQVIEPCRYIAAAMLHDITNIISCISKTSLIFEQEGVAPSTS